MIHSHVVLGENVVLGADCEIFPGTLLGKIPKGAGATSREIRFERGLTIGKGCAIGPNATVFYGVSIGSLTLLGDGASIREGCTVGNRCIISRFVTINYQTSVGNRVKVMDCTHLTGKMRIEDDVFISVHVSTTNDNAPGSDKFSESNIVGPTIRKGAIVGAGAILLPGVEIGRSAVVGAGSVVTKSVSDRTTVVGIPARVRV